MQPQQYRVSAAEQSIVTLLKQPLACQLIPERPRHELMPSQRQDVREVRDMLKTARGVYVSAEAGSGKTTFGKAIADELKREKNVLFWSFLDTPKHPQGVHGFLEAVRESLRVSSDADIEPLPEDPAQLSHWAHQISARIGFFSADRRPVLFILDDVDRALAKSEHCDLLATILRDWTACQFLLLGAKKPNLASLPKSCELVEYTLKGLRD